MEDYYNRKIDFLYEKYIELFENLLINNNVTIYKETRSLYTLGYKVNKYYPDLKTYINNICYIFGEKNNTEEKLDLLLNMYPKIMEVLNEN